MGLDLSSCQVGANSGLTSSKRVVWIEVQKRPPWSLDRCCNSGLLDREFQYRNVWSSHLPCVCRNQRTFTSKNEVMLTVAAYLFSQSTCYSNRIDGSAASYEHFGDVAVNLSSAQTSCCSPLGGMERDILGLHRESPCAL